MLHLEYNADVKTSDWWKPSDVLGFHGWIRKA